MEHFPMTVEDRRIFGNFVRFAEDCTGNLLDCDLVEHTGIAVVFPDFKFVGEIRQWAAKWYEDLGTP